MARASSNTGLMPSLVDRLIDPESGGTAWRQGYGVEQMVDAVRADLEELLNTRRSCRDLPAEYPETADSVLVFGLPDLTSMNAATTPQRREIGRVIEEVIRRFEPRLKNIRATLVGAEGHEDRRLRFHIDARLAVDPAPEVGFETVLELTTGHASIKPGSAES